MNSCVENDCEKEYSFDGVMKQWKILMLPFLPSIKIQTLKSHNRIDFPYLDIVCLLSIHSAWRYLAGIHTDYTQRAHDVKITSH